MNKQKTSRSKPIASEPDPFMQALRKTLEHINDKTWLDKHSPLAGVFFAGASTSTERQRQVILTGRQDVDDHLRSIWHEWETRPRSPLQALVWEAVCHLPTDLETEYQAILLLSYFDERNPKQSEVIETLAMGRSTYYRHLERAVETLANRIVRTLHPSLQLEQPVPKRLIGRDNEQKRIASLLKDGRIVHLIGGGGIGKSSLAANVAADWPYGVFWFTFRSGFNDYFDLVLFNVAFFLHEQGASGLWTYLTTTQEPISAGRAMMALREHLTELQDRPPLFCFDEVDLLLGDELHDSEERAQLRAFFDEWTNATGAKLGLSKSPMLLIGQKLLLEPERECLFQLTPFGPSELTLLLAEEDISVAPEEQEQMCTITHGNPLLLNLFLTLHQRGQELTQTLSSLQKPITLSWFVTRLRRHLQPAEQVVMDELSVFPDGAPLDGWSRTRKHINTLTELGLADNSGVNKITLHNALRILIYEQIPHSRRAELHLAAGQLLAERGHFTAAAWHYVQGARPELAIWTWYTHRQQEIDQGRISNALDIFMPLTQTSLPRADDERALALLVAPLLVRVGRAQEGVTILDQSTWRKSAYSTAIAHEMRGELLAQTGQVERSLDEFRRSLDDIKNLRATQESELHLKLGRRALTFLGDQQTARTEVAEARLSLEVLEGELNGATGNHELARDHYRKALKLAQANATDHRLAKVHEGLGRLEARYGEFETAVEHIKLSGDYYSRAGNMIAAKGIANTGLAFICLLNRRHAEAIEPAKKAIDFFHELDHAYWCATNELYLAEAYFYLGNLEKAEDYVHRSLAHEEVVVRPHCLHILGQVRRVQKRFAEAEQYGKEALAIGEEDQDLWVQAPAWSGLGEIFRDKGEGKAAQAAFAKALAIWQRLEIPREIEEVQKLMKA